MANATTLIFLIILSAPLFQTVGVQTQQQTQKHSIISLGSSLTPTTNSSWLSPSGLYAFGFYPERNGYVVGVFMVGIPEQTVVWNSRDSAPVSSNATLALTSEGSLIIQQPQTQEFSITGLSQPASSASMFDSGNFVLYDSNDNIIWQSFDHATDTILPGQLLKGDQGLVSSASETDHSSGIFFLVMLNNGNLIQMSTTAALPSPDYFYWQTNTQGNGVTLNLDGDGRLYLCDAMNNNIHNVTDAEPPTKEVKIYMMKIDVDGIFRVYSRAYPKGKWSIWWYSTMDKCAPQGLCGLNGYCVLNDTEANCKCLPQFAPLVPGKWSAGCVSNFIAQNCKDSNGNTGYKMSQLDDIAWEELSYWWRHVSSKECEDACLQDCNCDVAQYKDGLCKKQRLPLRFGRRSPDDTRVTFIKVGTSEEPNTQQAIPGAQDNPPMKAKKKLHVDILIIGISLSALGFMLLAISGVLVYKNHVFLAYKKIPNEKGNLELGEDVPLRTFTLAELEQVTNGFKEELGRGAFGTVFKGIISYNSKDVAVKRLDKVLTEGEREFQTEIKVIGRTHHRNLVHLIGYCLDGPHRLLVYEYMSNGSLADFIFTPENRPSWDKRIGIALDVARGILYLHEECETPIIHCDIKPQNILMDEQERAKISDFGLAKLLKPGQTKTFTGIRGTRGYVAPEWHRKLPITVKADIYSFGVMLLEIICCRKCLELSLFEEQIILEEWVYDCFEARELGKLVGDENVDMRKLERMVKVGLWCIQDNPSLRPSMKKVMMMLEGIVNIPMPPNPTSF